MITLRPIVCSTASSRPAAEPRHPSSSPRAVSETRAAFAPCPPSPLAPAPSTPQAFDHARAQPTPAAPGAAPAPRRRALARPAAFSSGEWSAGHVAFAGDDAEQVSPQYRGLTPPQLEQAFRAAHPGLLEALASATAHMTPATAAPLLRRLEAELPPTLTDVAPGGDCVLVAIEPGLAPLLERAAACCEASLHAGEPRHAASAAAAALSLLSRLTFGGAASAAPYAAAGTRCKQALKAAYDAGAEVRQEDAVELYRSCARASPWLWLTPYAGLRFAAAVDDAVTAGWHTGELAVRFTEAYAQLVGSGRYAQVERRFVRLVQAALRHPLSLQQAGRLLAAERRLPVEMRIQLSLHARSEPASDWHAQLQAVRRLREREAVQSAALERSSALSRHAAAQPQRGAAQRRQLVAASRAQRSG